MGEELREGDAESMGSPDSKRSSSRTAAVRKGQAKVWIRFEVELEVQPRKGEAVWLSGSSKSLGDWAAAGVRLRRRKDGVWYGRVYMRRNSLVFFKFTLGSWDRVEVQPDGKDAEDRELRVKRARTVKCKVARWADGPRPKAHSTRDEHVIDLGIFGKRSTGTEHKVLVHVPPSYEEDGETDYKVLYMLDGENIFDCATAFGGHAWDADQTHDRLVEEGLIEPFFIVAIYHNCQRERIFTPIRDRWLGIGGEIDQLERLIMEELDPVVRKRFRIESGPWARAVCGSSLGGLASFHLGWRHPRWFGYVVAMSPSLWWGHYHTISMISRDNGSVKPNRFWIDMGTHESEMPILSIRDVTNLTALMAERGHDVALYLDEGARHSELAWKDRLAEVFKWLWSSPPPAPEGRVIWGSRKDG